MVDTALLLQMQSVNDHYTASDFEQINKELEKFWQRMAGATYETKDYAPSASRPTRLRGTAAKANSWSVEYIANDPCLEYLAKCRIEHVITHCSQNPKPNGRPIVYLDGALNYYQNKAQQVDGWIVSLGLAFGDIAWEHLTPVLTANPGNCHRLSDHWQWRRPTIRIRPARPCSRLCLEWRRRHR